MPSRKEKCPTCGSTVKKQEYKSQIQTKRMRYSKECLSLTSFVIRFTGVVSSPTDVISTCDCDCDNDFSSLVSKELARVVTLEELYE